MLRPLRNRVRAVSALVAAGFVALWFGSFASACMAATGPACGMSGGECAKMELSMVATPCEQATAPCELPSLNAPVSGQFDFSFAPVVTGTVSPSVVEPTVRNSPPEDWRATRPASTPLYLAYLTLLN